MLGLLGKLVVVALAVSPSSATFSSHFSGLREKFSLHALRSIAPTSSNSSILPTIANQTSGSRVGHTAVYLTATQELLFIGGQVGETGLAVTNSILTFRLNTSFVFGQRAIPSLNNNPSLSPKLSLTLPPHAWAAAAVDAVGRIFIIGGVTRNCNKDGAAYVLEGGSWSTPLATPRAPPRRRQAQAISINNATSELDDIYVFGGIAEPYTCSRETTGYLGMDRWTSGSGEVQNFPWMTPAGAEVDYEPAVSDYTGTLLGNGNSIAYIGGQSAEGVLANMGQILIFDSRVRAWSLQRAAGDIPTPRMGHVAVMLPSGAILIHGGVGLDREPLSDIHLLTPPARFDPTSRWTWSKPSMSPSTMPTPARAWHTATRIVDGQIIIAFGLDDASGLSEIMFLKSNAAGVYSWTDRFSGLPLNIFDANAPKSLAVVNPKSAMAAAATSALSALVPLPSSVAPTLLPSVSIAPNVPSSIPSNAPLVPIESISFSSPDATPTLASTPSEPTTSIPASEAESSAVNIAQIGVMNAAQAAAKKTAIAAGSVGSVVAVIALVALVLFLLRRRLRKRNEFPAQTPEMHSQSTFSGPPVSTLMYTRPRTGRKLSLGSTASPRVQQSTGGSHFGMEDPFSDFSRVDVDEMGQRTPRDEPSVAAPPEAVPSAFASIASTISAASYPFLGLIHRTESHESQLTRTPSNGSSGSANSQDPKGQAPAVVPSFFDVQRPKQRESWENYSPLPEGSDNVDRGMRPDSRARELAPIPSIRLPFALPSLPVAAPLFPGFGAQPQSVQTTQGDGPSLTRVKTPLRIVNSDPLSS